MLEIKNIHIAFERTLFNNAQIQFYDSSIHAIVGKSGSGKTTFLKSILHDSTYVQSKMYYNNVEVLEKDDFVRNHVAYVDQLGSFFPNMTIKQHFQFYAEMKKEKVDANTMNQYLEKVNLYNININKLPSILSIGERKRLLIALALFCDKDIIILDEPTASLDKKNIDLLKDLLLSLKDKTIILTTHTPEILEICHVIYKIENQAFLCQKKDIDDQQEIQNVSTCHHQFSFIKYFRYKSPIQWIQYIGVIAISIFILIQSSLIIDSFFSVSYVNPLTTNQSSKEMLFIRHREGDLIWNYAPSVDNDWSRPFSESELNKIKQLDGVKDIKKFDALTTYESDNASQDLTVIKETGKSNTYSVIDFGSRAPQIFPYYESNDFNDHDDGVYISYWMSQTYDIQEGDTIKANFYVPKDQYVVENGQEYRSTTYTLRNMEFQVDKVLGESEAYETAAVNMIIYIPYEKLMDIINHRDENEEVLSSYYIDNVLSKQVQPEPYAINEYVLFVDEDYVFDVYNSILEMDDKYDVYSTYMESYQLSQLNKQAFQSKLLGFGAICGIGLIAILTIQYFLMKSRKKEFQLLEDNGIQDKLIKKSLLLDNLIYFISIMIGGLLWIYIDIERYNFVVYQCIAILGICFVLLFIMQMISYVTFKRK
ncbi:MAG TPA: ATP-binding cassette domain-containing protein [Candidatus Massiliomicrobiota merdigallinarum]|nr:ATP-binding cassette domain-containing protein [Candidatus Massilimicrobiota merdigallinarum]